MGKKCNDIEGLKKILDDASSSVNDIGGDSKQIDYKIDETVVSIYEGTGTVTFRGKKSNCNVQEVIEKKIDALNELSTPIQCNKKKGN
ncbi:hypothetical protein [Halarcobacter sp.]|uniref:hypothetical protein n=1 Tax=Halarcobacter sp. TaxID=2321133 RepID=UPI002AAB81D3|nr:hypothetical protein [Halarcobacter sp.]